MEIKANFVLIGAFALFGLFASMGMLLWLAKFQADRQFAYYDILFDSVSGLNQAGDVRYNGLPVGQVVNLELDEEDHTKVRVRIEVDDKTPIKADTVAQLQSQGVTGVSFVSLTGGSPDSLPVPENSVIRSQPSAFQSLLEGAPELLERAVELLENVNEVVNEENRATIGTILDNVASASARLDRTLEDFESLSSDLGAAARDVASFSSDLAELAEPADSALSAATEALNATTEVMERAGPVVDRAGQTLAEIDKTFQTATAFIESDLEEFTREGTAAAKSIEETLTVLTPDVQQSLSSSRGVLNEAQKLFASVNTLLDGDVGAILSDARSAVNVFSVAVSSASEDFTKVSEDVLKASRSAAEFTGRLEQILAANQPQVSAFLRSGLPEFTRLTEETRILVSNLDRFVKRVQRDPARFFLGTQGSEFSR